MVSFQCEGCGDIVKKPKCKVHRCRAPFTCIDCHQTFNGTSYQSHNQCMTEEQKFQKGYKPPTKKSQQQQQQPKPAATTGLMAQLEKKKEETEKKRSLEEEENAKVESKKAKKKSKKETKSLSEWSVDELDSDETKQMELALHYILKKDKDAHSIEHVRDQVVSLIASHPKSKDTKTSALKTKFDQVVGLTFNTKKNKVAYTFIKN